MDRDWQMQAGRTDSPTAADARDVMLEGDLGILSICPNSNRRPSNHRSEG